LPAKAASLNRTLGHNRRIIRKGAGLTRKTLYRNWRWTSLGAIASFAVLALVDSWLKAATGFGTLDLQKVATAAGFIPIIAAWAAPNHAAGAGFGLGFDYLFMPLYGAAFYFGAIVARDAFAPKPGLLRRAMTLLAAVPIAGALFDAVENGLETFILTHGPTDLLAGFAYQATSAKSICFFIGLALWVFGLASLFGRRNASDD
jgi:hypothetical protein